MPCQAWHHVLCYAASIHAIDSKVRSKPVPHLQQHLLAKAVFSQQSAMACCKPLAACFQQVTAELLYAAQHLAAYFMALFIL